MKKELLGLSAVLAVSVAAWAGDSVGFAASDRLTISESQGVYRLSLDGGAAFHTTPNVIENPRLIAVPGDDDLLILWNETGAGDSSGPYFAMYENGVLMHAPRPAEYTFGFRYAPFDPLAGEPGIHPALAADAGNELYLVQFWTAPLDSFRAAIRAEGGVLHDYIHPNAYVVRMNAATAERISALPMVRWVGAYHPAYRLENVLVGEITRGVSSDPSRRFSIMTWEYGGLQGMALSDAITRMGARVVGTDPGTRIVEAMLTIDQVAQVARMNEVMFMDIRGENELDMDIVREMTGSNYIESQTGFSGEGVRAEVADSGLYRNHQEFPWQAQILDHDWGGIQDTHGTSVFSVTFAAGVQAIARGAMPDAEARIMCNAANLRTDGNIQRRYDHTGRLVNPSGPYRAIYQTNSTGDPRTTQYTTLSAAMDTNLFDHDIVHCQSMSNAAGTPDVRPQAWAKNIIGVGGITHFNNSNRADDIASGSSGPASDGRIKPELSHFYDGTRAASSGTNVYTDFSGTSNATPCTCSHLGLFHQLWHEGVFKGFGGGASVFDSRPHMTMAKTILTNTAFRYNWKAGGANASLIRIKQGWGMVDLKKLYDNRDKMFIIDESDVLKQGEVSAYDVDVNPGEAELVASMSYADTAGVPGNTTRHAKNDVSLTVTSPSGTVYRGNNGLMADNFSTPGGANNDKDTLEHVIVPNPEPGQWKVEVSAPLVVEDGHVETPGVLDVDYALVVRGVAGGGGGDPCEAFKSLSASCKGGNLKAKVKFNDTSWNGRTITLSMGGTNVDVVVSGKKAKAKLCCFSGLTTVKLVAPAGCLPDAVADCG